MHGLSPLSPAFPACPCFPMLAKQQSRAWWGLEREAVFQALHWGTALPISMPAFEGAIAAAAAAATSRTLGSPGLNNASAAVAGVWKVSGERRYPMEASLLRCAQATGCSTM